MRRPDLDRDGELRRIAEEFKNIESEEDLRRLNQEASAEEESRRAEARGELPKSTVTAMIVGAVVVIALIAGGVFFGTSRANTPKVPDVIGETANAAQEKITAAGLRAVIEYNTESTSPKGKVFRQEPKAGARMKPGSDVTAIVSGVPPTSTVRVGASRMTPAPAQQSRTPETTANQAPQQMTTTPNTVQVPNVAEMTESRARQELAQAGLQVEVATVTDATKANGIVIACDPAPYTVVQQGATVRISVNAAAGSSQGGTARSVPSFVLGDYTGLDAQRAYSDLQQRGANVSWRQETSQHQRSGMVVRTEPAAGATITAGSEVVIIVAN